MPRKQFLNNTIWTATDLLSYPLLMILATPFFIRKLGPELYGLWMLINVVVQMMNALNFGVGDSTIKEVSRFQAIDSLKNIQQTFSRNLSLSIILMLISVCAGILFAVIINHWNLFHIPDNLKIDALLALVLLSWSAGLKFIEQVFVAVFKGMQRFDVAARLTMLSRLSAILGAIVAVYLDYGILMIVKVTLACNIANVFIQAYMVYRYTVVERFTPSFSLSDIEQLLQSNGWYWLQSVIALLGFLSDRLFLGYLSDLKTLGYYSIAALIGSQIQNVLLAFGSFVFPKVSAYHALNKGVDSIYFTSRFLIAGLGWSTILLLILFGDFIFSLWLGAETYHQAANYITLYLCFISTILLTVIPYHFINGSSKVYLNSIFELTLRGSHLIGMYIGFMILGVEGLLWGLIITTAINMPFQYYHFHKQILGFSSIVEACIPLMPVLVLLGFSQSSNIGLKVCLLLLFGIVIWQFYFKKSSINVKAIFKRL